MTQGRKDSLLVRVAEKVSITSAGCWLFSGWLRPDGYGKIWSRGRMRSVHREVFEHMRFPLPEGVVLDHLCRNRSCCNPSHLDPVTNRENTLRGQGIAAINARREVCKRGHPLVGPEADVAMRGRSRQCRACIRENYREKRSARISA